MAVYKRGKWYWMDAIVNGVRYRERLGTTDKRMAPGLERERISQLKDKAPEPNRGSKAFASLPISEAVVQYAIERGPQVSVRMRAYWHEQAKPLASSKAFGSMAMKKISPVNIAAYQAERLEQGRAPKTINGEISVLRQLLKRARLWYRFQEEYKPIRNLKAPVGRALTAEEVERLFEAGRSRRDWQFAYTAAVLAFFCGMRTCEIKGLRWGDVDWEHRLLEIKRSKTPAGWRTPSLNAICVESLASLRRAAQSINAAEENHFIFPWHGREQKIDPTKPMSSWRTAWRSMRKEAGLTTARFHDGRHTAITTLAEKGLPDWVIQAQVGHIDPQMMRTYSHIRRKALNEAAAALEPNYKINRSPSGQGEEVSVIG